MAPLAKLLLIAASLPVASSLYRTTLEVRHEFASPDCVDRLVVSVNRSIPSPPIEVLPGEEVEITVVNMMHSNAVAIHWHGMVHKDSGPWSDGSSMISQCPIPPMGKWVYRFKANDHPGTYQYHGHVGGMRVAGLGGAFIIKGNVSDAAAEADGGDSVFHLTDWYHAEETQLTHGLLETRFRWAGDPQSVLVNGKGKFNCTDNVVYGCRDDVCVEGLTSAALHAGIADTDVIERGEVCGAGQRPWYRPSYHPPTCEASLCPGIETMDVDAGKTYMLRFINGGALSLFNVAIQNHSMTVVEVDGTPTQRYQTDSIDLNSGQRVSVLVTMDQPPSVYVVRVNIRARSSQRAGHALLAYRGSAISPDSVDPETATIAQPAWNDNNFTFDFQRAIRGLYTGDTGVEAVPNDAEVQRTFVMLSTQERTEPDTTFNAVPSVDNLTVALGQQGQRPQDFCDSAGNTKPLRWLLGRRTWKGSGTPALSTIYFDLPGTRVAEENNYYQVQVGKVYDMVIQNYPACNGVCETHAWHTHGMHFWVLGTGRGEWIGSAEQLASLNREDPAYRDVVQTVSEGVDNRPFGSSAEHGPCGWTMVRFRVQSPGAWYFHCHQIWHIVMGSNAVLYTPRSSIPPPPRNLMLCGDMTVDSVIAARVSERLGGEMQANQTEDASAASRPRGEMVVAAATMALLIAIR